MLHTIQQKTMKAMSDTNTEKTPQLLARLLKSGGRILVVGGEIKDLPQRYHDHPGLLLWDDNQQSIEHKEVPSNVKAILWNRWVSHAVAGRLNDACRRLRALKFPMLRTQEIKLLLAEIVQSEPTFVANNEAEQVLQDFDQQYAAQEAREAAEIQPPQEGEESEMSKRKTRGTRGWLVQFIAKHINVNKDYTVRGSMAEEGVRIYEKAREQGIKTTQASVVQAVRGVLKSMNKATSRSGERRVEEKATSRVVEGTRIRGASRTSKDDFEELDTLIQDAIAAMKLVQEQMPKVRKETERLREMRGRMLKMLGVEE